MTSGSRLDNTVQDIVVTEYFMGNISILTIRDEISVINYPLYRCRN